MIVVTNAPYLRGLFSDIEYESLKHSKGVISLAPNYTEDCFGRYVLYVKSHHFDKLRDYIYRYKSLGDEWDKFSLKHGWKGSSLRITYYKKDANIVKGRLWDNEKLFTKLFNLFSKDNLRKNATYKKDLTKKYRIGIRQIPIFKNTVQESLTGPWDNIQISLEFDTQEEENNFLKSLDTWPYRVSLRNMKDRNPAHLPYLRDYTKEWTDEDLFEYFNITEDERKIIESFDLTSTNLLTNTKKEGDEQ